MIMSGMAQAEIGATLAEKWNFPEPIVVTIRYQDNFENAPEEHRELVESVCFADFMLNFSNAYDRLTCRYEFAYLVKKVIA